MWPVPTISVPIPGVVSEYWISGWLGRDALPMVRITCEGLLENMGCLPYIDPSAKVFMPIRPILRAAATGILLYCMLKCSRSLALMATSIPVSYTHLRAHETVLDLVCRLLLE